MKRQANSPRTNGCSQALNAAVPDAGAEGEATPNYEFAPVSEELPLEFQGASVREIHLQPGPCALEDDGFPFESLSEVAEIESWRKELNRPPYYIHKWWARRLGTVFRAMVIGAFAPKGANLLDLFYQPTRIWKAVVFDPFMGSGTTIGEAAKLGSRAIGRDINPVAQFLVHNGMSRHDRKAILDTFQGIKRDVADDIGRYYRTTVSPGVETDVLYYLWVKTVDCPACASPVDLFASHIFARHANSKQHPKAQALCPRCGSVNQVGFDTRELRCGDCGLLSNPQQGAARGKNAVCPSCSRQFPIAPTVRNQDGPPRHRLYAKITWRPSGGKCYLPTTSEDLALYAEAEQELAQRADAYPIVAIEPGYNTNQAIGYNYRYWHQMFNARQLLCLSILADRIRNIEDASLRDLFACLFSGVLEFNNLFASYKGEGTGAVRHMFSHHILKPERVPLEANLWGTPRSSGAFSTLFENRVKRFLDYAENPFELRVSRRNGKKVGEKVYGLSEKLGFSIAPNFSDFASGRRIYLSCGDSGSTDLADQSVDAIICDPPFFDNVHYSQLADFFHVWQRHILGTGGHRERSTTRSVAEVQNGDAKTFSVRLAAVWREAHRTLKHQGVLAFTYHHSKPEGWQAVLEALMQAGFTITAAHPIKSELSVAVPKTKANEPIDLDIIIVCRKKGHLHESTAKLDYWPAIQNVASEQVKRLRSHNRPLSRGDLRVIVMAQVLRQLSKFTDLVEALRALQANRNKAATLVEELYLAS